MEIKNHAIAVFVGCSKGILLVRDFKKPLPVFWKLPGGRSLANEKPIETAIREIKEELGISLDQDDLRNLYSESRGNHDFTLFHATISDMTKIKEKGNEGEEIKLFSIEEIDKMDDFFPNHHKILHSLKII